MKLVVCLLLALAGCSSLSNNDDGVAVLEVQAGVNPFLEPGVPLQLRGVARNSAGDSVDIPIVWRASDTTLVRLDSLTGVIEAKAVTGTVQVQASTRGKSPIVTDPFALTFTLTAKAESLQVVLDSLDVLTDATTSPPLQAMLFGIDAAPVAGRPVQFRIIEPAYGTGDTPGVQFSTFRIADSTQTSTLGIASMFLTRVTDQPTPARVVVEVRAFHATGAPILGSGQQIVVRFEP